MADRISPFAGKLPKPSQLINVQELIKAYYTGIPDPKRLQESVIFGTSGHRGTALHTTFNEWHILAISQAICLYRKQQQIDGPLFLGIDTHALSVPAFASALEVFSANEITVLIAERDEYTPTPVISHAILTYNRSRKTGFADGVVVTPSHDPPHDGGFKYNPPNGGPADLQITTWIEAKANEFLANGLQGVRRIPFETALQSPYIHRYDFLNHYVNDLENVIDMAVIRDAKIHIGVDPLGGAGIHYWPAIADRYGLQLTVVNKEIDPTFRFMTLDWDGEIRMDPSSVYAMESLIDLKNHFDIAFACDTDHDRHGIVTPSQGLLPANHYLAVALDYLIQQRSQWDKEVGVGKTVVTSEMINRVSQKLNRPLSEMPVGFKWFVEGLFTGTLGFCGEESAGAAFSRINGKVWTTDKDGIIAALLAAEITARTGRDPGERYEKLEEQLGHSFFKRVDAPASPAEKKCLKNLSPAQIKVKQLAGEVIQVVLSQASGNHQPIGGLKISTQNGWFAARPSGTEAIYRIYAESFKGTQHLENIIQDAQDIIQQAFKEH